MLSKSSVPLHSFLALPKCLAVGEDVLEQYLTQRQEIIDEESSDLFGADIILNDEEQAANEVLMNLKLREIGTEQLYLSTCKSTKRYITVRKNTFRNSREFA